MREIKHLSIHQCIRFAIPDSQQPTSPIGFLFLKLPPPPCAVLLVLMGKSNISTVPFSIAFCMFTRGYWCTPWFQGHHPTKYPSRRSYKSRDRCSWCCWMPQRRRKRPTGGQLSSAWVLGAQPVNFACFFWLMFCDAFLFSLVFFGLGFFWSVLFFPLLFLGSLPFHHFHFGSKSLKSTQDLFRRDFVCA